MSSSSPVNDSARKPSFVRMPDELLDKLFDHVFAGLQRKPLREIVPVYAPLSLVCKAWQRVAVPHAYINVILDVAKDSGAIACLDPVGGAGAHLLKLVKTIELSTSKPLLKGPVTGDEEAENAEEEEGEDSDATPARTAPLLHGPADDETSALPIVASLARVLANCPNLLHLTIDQHLESVSCKVTADQDPVVMWPKLTELRFNWRASFIDLLPVLARLSRLQTLTAIVLLLVTSDENNDPRGTMTQELVDKYLVQPLERLQSFGMRSFAEAPIGNKAVLQLISPHAPLQQVQWGGYIPPGMCKQLSYGTSEIKELTFTWMLPTLNLTNQLLPQLLELGRRPVKRLTLDIGPASDIPRTQFMPPITEILKKIPYGVRFSRATDMDSILTFMGFQQQFATGGADFAAIKARPTAEVTFNNKCEWGGSLDGKPLLQVGIFHVEKESDDDVVLRFFGRFGNPGIEGDVTEWMQLKVVSGGDDDGSE
ncbi:hypothetical protein C6P46_001870 [Rhodotorula mucilaginosa]|uniref:F-box domain-containing protein n=1 Tax=Rhodotorula mucilaginosa TaxID=5537 RepID=A0A9P6VUF9_RHOMI|nr:hypothetical protein C6P46_001870 [Rhodotorula mucilaginosa]TKA52849.1 hypothetical protein B0A53_04545 [Rhodotorula sp. CCFEE 5036]